MFNTPDVTAQDANEIFEKWITNGENHTNNVQELLFDNSLSIESKR